MLLLHALLLLLLSISAMATPVPGKITGRAVLQEQIFSLERPFSSQDAKTLENEFWIYRGLWRTVNIPLLIPPRMNLTSYLPCSILVKSKL